MCIPATGEKRYMRYCPVCALEDREKYGETVWHREHQIQRICVCPQHRCYLENTRAVVSSKSSPGLHDAESFVPFYSEPLLCSYIREIGFDQYLIKVMREPVDMDDPLPIGRFLHSRLSSDYLNDMGTLRNISNLYTDYLSFFGDMTIRRKRTCKRFSMEKKCMNSICESKCFEIHTPCGINLLRR